MEKFLQINNADEKCPVQLEVAATLKQFLTACHEGILGMGMIFRFFCLFGLLQIFLQKTGKD